MGLLDLLGWSRRISRCRFRMLKPNAHLKELIGRATADQQRRAVEMASRHVRACKGLDAPTVGVDRILQEALEIAMSEPPEDANDALLERHRFYMRRTYSRHYEEQ